ncbi:hypothetical protein JVU11DRAFT_2591 [Chiua virens]|nr:hypothetical protein JVU11DRAFT_2591 [Chiua virens]
MQAYSSKIFNAIARHILGLTLYDMMRSSVGFEDVRAALNDRVAWSIDLFRSCFTIHLISGNYFFTLLTLAFLFMAENIHIHYGRLSPMELKARAEHMSYATFAILFGVLDIGFVAIRIAGLFVLTGSPVLSICIFVAGMSPSVLFPLFASAARHYVPRRRELAEDVEVESGVAVEGSQGTGRRGAET